MAELPTIQKTLAACAPLTSFTLLADAVRTVGVAALAVVAPTIAITPIGTVVAPPTGGHPIRIWLEFRRERQARDQGSAQFCDTAYCPCSTPPWASRTPATSITEAIDADHETRPAPTTEPGLP